MKRYVFFVLCVLCAAGAVAKDNLAILPFTGGQGEEGETIDATNRAERRKVVSISRGYRERNSTTGPGDNLDSSVSGRAGGWE